MSEKQDPRTTHLETRPDPAEPRPADSDVDPEYQEELFRLVVEIDDPTPEEAGYGHGV